MKKLKIQNLLPLLIIIFAAEFVFSCSSVQSTAKTTQPHASAMVQAKSGAELWGESCSRCHNAPPPQVYSDAQWEVVSKHMRIRTNLTQAEIDKIIEFIKSAD